MVKFPASDQDIKCPVVESDGGVSGEPIGAGGSAGLRKWGEGGDADRGRKWRRSRGWEACPASAEWTVAPTRPGAGGADAGSDEPAREAATTPVTKRRSMPRRATRRADPPQPGLRSAEPACIDYCNQIIGSADGGPPLCQGSYESIDQCQQYCARAQWTAGTAMDMKDSMGCRLYSLNDARSLLGMSPMMLQKDCAAGGPSGGSGPTACGLTNAPPGVCTTFCNALAKICPDNASGCLTACQNASVVGAGLPLPLVGARGNRPALLRAGRFRRVLPTARMLSTASQLLRRSSSMWRWLCNW